MPDKIIVTNEYALKAKYKPAGLAAIKKALQALIAADQKRGLKTTYTAIDSASAMRKVGGKAVTDPADPKQNKDAVDAIFKKLAPDYILLLGAPDVIPHQDLKNPVYSAGNDDDKLAPGDLPYACEAPYSNKPEDFIGPTRVVGRLPDLTGASDPKYLLDLIATAAGYTQRKPSDYSKYLGISASVWKASTAQSLQNTFGSNADLQLVPPQTEKWSKTMLARRAHFINCHGADTDAHFYGQKGDDYPVSLDASLLKGQISEGTVAAMECCYGSQLYDPSKTQGQAGISSTYLGEKAYGYLGSTTIAYGPAKGNGSADLICQFFLRRVLAGSSLGRAALEARQEFAQSSPQISPTDLKTLAQFNLLGDPSIIPVLAPTPHAAVTAAAGLEAERGDRRRQLMTRGIWLVENRPVAKSARMKARPSIARLLDALAKQGKIKAPAVLSFAVKSPPAERRSLTRAMLAKSPPIDSFHVIMGKSSTKESPVPLVKALVASVRGGSIVSVQELFGKQ